MRNLFQEYTGGKSHTFELDGDSYSIKINQIVTKNKKQVVATVNGNEVPVDLSSLTMKMEKSDRAVMVIAMGIFAVGFFVANAARAPSGWTIGGAIGAGIGVLITAACTLMRQDGPGGK